ncbi:MAG: ATP-binding cassette domain-containing protein [Bacteroidales bacterium]|nr:ATP-binding cassette domain-containing protein [Bacteroidales bacterium]
MIIGYEQTDIYQAEHLVLKNVNFQVHEGELIYVVGPVGSGKTSLLRTIYGELTPTMGRAEVMGYDMLSIRANKLPSLRKQIGIIFQDFRLLPDRSVKDNLDFVLRATGWSKKDKRQRRIEEVLDKVGLQEKINHRPYELSGGEQQRICIARAILNTPKLIIADEPTGNLDNENGRNIIQLLDSLRTNGVAVIITTHNMQWLHEVPGTVYRCNEGLLINEQTILPEISEEQMEIGNAIPSDTPVQQFTPTRKREELKSIDELLENKI